MSNRGLHLLHLLLLFIKVYYSAIKVQRLKYERYGNKAMNDGKVWDVEEYTLCENNERVDLKVIFLLKN